jgi:hypothetical protein
MEVWLPIAFTNGNATPLAEGRTLFVDFQVADNQHGEGRSSQAWLDGMDPDVDTQNNNPYAFRGSVTLGAAAPAPAAAEEPEAAPEAPAVIDTPAAPVVTAAAPQTADPVSLIIIGSLISAAGLAISKKRK